MDQGFEGLCRRCWSDLVRTAFLITGDRHDALDVAQESLARAFERWDRVSSMENPDGWVHRVAANLAISKWRRRRLFRRARVVVPDETVELQTVDLDLLDAVRSLSPQQRAVVALRFYADWSVEEVSETLGKRPGTVRATTAQALAKLREALTREEIDDHTR